MQFTICNNNYYTFWQRLFLPCHVVFKSWPTKALCPVTSGLVSELQSSPQEAREPQPHLQHPDDLTAAQPPVPAHPDPRGAAVHSLWRPGGVNALCTTLLHRQWEPDFLWIIIWTILIDFSCTCQTVMILCGRTVLKEKKMLLFIHFKYCFLFKWELYKTHTPYWI